MAKGKTNPKVRVELWLPPRFLRNVEKHLTKPKESRKQALERILLVNAEHQINKQLKLVK